MKRKRRTRSLQGTPADHRAAANDSSANAIQAAEAGLCYQAMLSLGAAQAHLDEAGMFNDRRWQRAQDAILQRCRIEPKRR